MYLRFITQSKTTSFKNATKVTFLAEQFGAGYKQLGCTISLWLDGSVAKEPSEVHHGCTDIEVYASKSDFKRAQMEAQVRHACTPGTETYMSS